MASDDAAPIAEFRAVATLTRRLFEVGGWRAVRVPVLNAVAGLTEGVGVLALAPLLRLLGVGGETTGIDDPSLALGLGGYVGLIIIVAAVGRTRTVIAQGVVLDFLDRLRTNLHQAIVAVEWAWYRSQRPADFQEALTGDIGRIGAAVNQLNAFWGAILPIPFVLAASFALSPALTGVAAAITGVAAFVTRRLGAAGFRLGRALGEVHRAALGDLVDDLAGLRLIKSFGVEVRRTAGLADRFAAVRRKQLALGQTQANERAVFQIVAGVAAAVTLGIAVRGLRLPLADALVLILAYGRLLQVALRGLATWRQLIGVIAALDHYDQTLAAVCAAAEPVGVDADLPVPAVEIGLTGVSVLYGRGTMARRGLDSVDARIPIGAVTAVIGPSGAGKSTLADLLAGLTRPDWGTMAIDGVVLSDDARRAWRRRVGLVPQDPFLFHDTIAANLRLGAPEADDATLWAALTAVAATEFVRAQPGGLASVVGDRGTRLSGGERQRIVLARALLRRPALLVLDEATAALDGETEAAVGETVARLRGTTTVVVIAHRAGTVRAADHVVMLERGRVAAAGSWDEVRRVAGDRLFRLGLIEAATDAATGR